MRTVGELTEYLALFDPDDLVCAWCPGQNDLDSHEGIVIMASPHRKNFSDSCDIGFFDNISAVRDVKHPCIEEY